MNCSRQELRRQDLLIFENGRLTIRDWDHLVEVGHCQPDYLSLSPPIWRTGRIPAAPARTGLVETPTRHAVSLYAACLGTPRPDVIGPSAPCTRRLQTLASS